MIYDTLILNHLESYVKAQCISKDRGRLVLYLQLQKRYTRLTDAESSRNPVRFLFHCYVGSVYILSQNNMKVVATS
jgi:hypothetical protein